MASQTKQAAITRYISPACGSWNDVMTFEPGVTAAPLAPLAVSTQHERPQLAPPPR